MRVLSKIMQQTFPRSQSMQSCINSHMLLRQLPLIRGGSIRISSLYACPDLPRHLIFKSKSASETRINATVSHRPILMVFPRNRGVGSSEPGSINSLCAGDRSYHGNASSSFSRSAEIRYGSWPSICIRFKMFGVRKMVSSKKDMSAAWTSHPPRQLMDSVIVWPEIHQTTMRV